MSLDRRFVILSRSEAALVPEAEILRCACWLAQDDNCFLGTVNEQPTVRFERESRFIYESIGGDRARLIGHCRLHLRRIYLCESVFQPFKKNRLPYGYVCAQVQRSASSVGYYRRYIDGAQPA